MRLTSHIGAEYGLKLVLFIDQDEYVGANTASAGVRERVQNRQNLIVKNFYRILQYSGAFMRQEKKNISYFCHQDEP